MKVLSSTPEVKAIEISLDIVYIRSNIQRIENENFIGWEYDEEQISKDEFIARLQNENASVKEEVFILQEVTFDAVAESENTKAEVLNLQELVFDLIVSQEGAG